MGEGGWVGGLMKGFEGCVGLEVHRDGCMRRGGEETWMSGKLQSNVLFGVKTGAPSGVA